VLAQASAWMSLIMIKSKNFIDHMGPLLMRTFVEDGLPGQIASFTCRALFAMCDKKVMTVIQKLQ